MSFPEERSAGLPQPRPDEPAALRQDIADELADHLRCAARREQQANASGEPLSDSAALQAAIDRFGEPAALARRLWWDAMKGRIMAQRFLAVMATTATVASLFACYLLWRSLQLAQAQQQASLDAQRAAMAAMIAELKSSKQADGAQWQTLKFRLVDVQAKPVKGTVYCSSNDKSPINETIRTGADGVASFFLPPGPYTARFQYNSLMAESAILLAPRSQEKTIVCPTAEQKRAPVSFAMELTDKSSLAHAPKPVFFIAVIQKTAITVDDLSWRLQGEAFEKNTECWLLDADGKILGQLTPSPKKPHQARTYFPESLGPNPELKPVEGLSTGFYQFSIAAYVPGDAKDSTPGDQPPDPAAPKEGTPALTLFAPSVLFLGRVTESKMIDVEKPDSQVFKITDKFFPQDHVLPATYR
ncbi:MAG TPA: hypothetical protein VGJ26_07885 [Pirellulales bacterium]